MNKFYRNGFVVCLVVILALLAYLYIENTNKDEVTTTVCESEKAELLLEKEELRLEIEDLNTKISEYESQSSSTEELETMIISLNEKIRVLESTIGSPLYLNEFELQLLNSMGITYVGVISDSLRNSIDVIATPGVLGGTMRFEDIYILNSQYVYATISDGHILGFGLYRYIIDENININWNSVYEEIY
jgi:hypothetical protein